MDLKLIQERIRQFRDERDWMQFHNPKNLAISISLEASELLEHFQWKTMEESEAYVVQAKEEIADEVADVAAYLIELADNLGIDLQEAILNKLAKNEAKYPAHKGQGECEEIHRTVRDDMQLVLQPCSSNDAYDHYLNTIDRLVETSRILPYLDEDDRADFKRTFPEAVAVWGVTQGKKAVNEKKWHQMDVGDVALFYRKKEFFRRGTIAYKKRLPNWPDSFGKLPQGSSLGSSSIFSPTWSPSRSVSSTTTRSRATTRPTSCRVSRSTIQS
ncbi:nucleotide pyrophosphohydrolase [Pseudomonas aeruginosa]|uniref:nucleotide pyrophosphohydrolase n=1 Tax=Pseudomonas aeruginosa TaxID=287 RepID=UPI003D2BEABD